MRWSSLLFCCLVLCTSCPADFDSEPVFVTVTGFELSTGAGEGAATSDITEVWAFAEGDFLGVFPLPARIPLVRQGEVTLRLEAGIRQDGRSVTPDIYPFYTPVERSVTLVPGEILDFGILPIRYRAATIFGFIEDFEPGRSRVFTEQLVGQGGLVPQSTVVFSGGVAGRLSLTADNNLVELASAELLRDLNEIPINVWLEVDYLSDVPVVFGVVGQQLGSPVRVFDPGFLPRGEWTKIYFNLSPVIGAADLAELQVALSALLPPELTEGNLFLDNVKLLYLQP